MTNYFTPPTPDAPEWVLDQALELVNKFADCEHTTLEYAGPISLLKALLFSIEQKAALQAELDQYKQDVSDAVEKFTDDHDNLRPQHWPAITRFILSKPKPDPLAEALLEISGEGGYDNFDHYAYRLRSALEARGVELREIEG